MSFSRSHPRCFRRLEDCLPAQKFSESAHAHQPRMQSVLLTICKNASDLGLIGSQRTDRRPRKPPQPGSDPGRSSSASTSHRTRESARGRPPSFADSQPPKIRPRAALFSRNTRPSPGDSGSSWSSPKRTRGAESPRPPTGHKPARQDAEPKTWQEPSAQILVRRSRASRLPAAPVIRPSTNSPSQRNATPAGSAILSIFCRPSACSLSATSPEPKTPNADA